MEWSFRVGAGVWPWSLFLELKFWSENMESGSGVGFRHLFLNV